MSSINPYTIKNLKLSCSECGKVSYKNFLEIESKVNLPCDYCGISIKVADQYGRSKLEEILQGLGRSGYILSDSNKG